MQVEVIPMLINSDFMNVPLDKLLHLADYKMYGEKSYVYQIKELLYGLYECTYLSMNDRQINGEAFEYLIKSKSAGKVLAEIRLIANKEAIERLSSVTAIANSSIAISTIFSNETAMAAILNSTTAMTAIANSTSAMSTIVNNTSTISAIFSNETAMAAILNSTTAMTAIANSPEVMTRILNDNGLVQKVINSPLIREINLGGGSWNAPPREIRVKGIIISFYCSDTNNALTVRKIDDTIITNNNDDRNAADVGTPKWKIWFARYSKNLLHHVMKKSITVASHYDGSKMRYIPIN